MAHINLIFRATFQGLKGPLNRGNFNTSHVKCEVEVYCQAKKWYTRFVGTKDPLIEYAYQVDPDAACNQVLQHFEKQASEWAMFEVLSDPHGTLIPVAKGEVYRDQKNGLYYRYSKQNVGLPGVEPPKMKAGELPL